MATRATAALAGQEQWLLADLVLAETIYVLESFYEVPRQAIAAQTRAALPPPSITVLDRRMRLRALEVYEIDRLDVAEPSLVAQAKATGVGEVLSFDRSLDGLPTVSRREP